MKPVVFFDQDGVLADFVRGSFAHHGKSIPIADVRWDFPQQIGFAMTEAASFWQNLDRKFWAGLSTLADGFALFREVECLVDRDQIGILSSPCDTVGCPDGKRDWVQTHLPAYRKRLFLGSAKELFAGPTKILIDDHDPNVDRFRAAGGQAVLVPRPWNERRAECDAAGGFPVDRILNEVIGAVLVASGSAV